jgi:hypothetical protein
VINSPEGDSVDDPTELLWIERAMNVCALFVAIGVSGEFIGNWIAGPIRHRIDSAKNSEIARLNKEAGDARKEAADAAERAAHLETQAEQERAARLIIEEKIAPRRLTMEQKDNMVHALSAFRGQKFTIDCAHGNSEAANLASDSGTYFRKRAGK